MRRWGMGGALALFSIGWIAVGAAYADPATPYTVDDVKAWLAAPASPTATPDSDKTCNRDAFKADSHGGSAPVHAKCGHLQMCIAPECSVGAAAAGNEGPSAHILHDFALQLTFETDKADLTEPDRTRLKVFADGIRNAPQRIQIDGYTDASGSRSHNLVLSRNRAREAMLYLEQLGIDSSRLSSEGHGPLAGATNDPSHRLVVAHKI